MDSHESRYEIYITKQAEQDAADIVKYIRDILNNITAAQAFHRKLREKAKSLEFNPERNRIVIDGKTDREGIRFIAVKNYMVFYQVASGKRVNIIRILNSKQDWNSILKRNKNGIHFT